MTNKFFKLLFLAVFAAILPLKFAHAFFGFDKRNYIKVVGSSTISPFMAAVSEEFAREQALKNHIIEVPVVESTGTHEGFKNFCGGIGLKYADFVNASSKITEGNVFDCEKNKVKNVVEIKIGYDGIIFGNSAKSKKIKLTKEQIFLALAEKIYDKKSEKFIPNPYKKWSEIDPSLPAYEISVYGPPLTSGTRDVFAELLLEDVCYSMSEFNKAYKNHDLRKKQCHRIRTDGRFIESGENDDLIIENLKKNPHAFGIFGFNFLAANRNVVQAAKIDNIEPTAQTISAKKYKLSRPLFVYFKKEHLNLVPDMSDFVRAIVSPETIGSKGYLINNGLISLSDEELNEVRKNVLSQL